MLFYPRRSASQHLRGSCKIVTNIILSPLGTLKQCKNLRGWRRKKEKGEFGEFVTLRLLLFSCENMKMAISQDSTTLQNIHFGVQLFENVRVGLHLSILVQTNRKSRPSRTEIGKWKCVAEQSRTGRTLSAACGKESLCVCNIWGTA